MHRISYGLMSLGILWACGGGDFSLFWSRQLVLLPIALIISLSTVFVEKKMGLLKPHSGSWMMGLGIGVIAAILGIVLASFWSESTQKLLAPPNTGALLISVIFIFSHELLFRGILQPEWGLWSSAFLSGINFGFGAQSLQLFIFITLASAVSGYTTKRFGFISGSMVMLLIYFSVLQSLSIL